MRNRKRPQPRAGSRIAAAIRRDYAGNFGLNERFGIACDRLDRYLPDARLGLP
jgi:hypothetical protein